MNSERSAPTGAKNPRSALHDHYGDGAWYDAEYVHIRGDIDYYRRVALVTDGPILELACGTGRLSFPMAEEGGPVHGLDNAPGMIAHANRKLKDASSEMRERLRFTMADMRTVRLEQRFSAVILAFNTLMHMTTDADLRGALETARAHLEPGGLFYLDIHTPYPETQKRDPNGRFDPQEMIDPHTQQRYVVTENNAYNPRTQINTMRFFYQQVDAAGSPVGLERRAVLQLRVIFPRELDTWLSICGFKIVGDYDDFKRERPFSGSGGRRVLIAKRRED